MPSFAPVDLVATVCAAGEYRVPSTDLLPTRLGYRPSCTPSSFLSRHSDIVGVRGTGLEGTSARIRLNPKLRLIVVLWDFTLGSIATGTCWGPIRIWI